MYLCFLKRTDRKKGREEGDVEVQRSGIQSKELLTAILGDYFILIDLLCLNLPVLSAHPSTDISSV